MVMLVMSKGREVTGKLWSDSFTQQPLAETAFSRRRFLRLEQKMDDRKRSSFIRDWKMFVRASLYSFFFNSKLLSRVEHRLGPP